MTDLHLGAVEGRFADIVWANAPVSTAALIALCAKEFGWKRTTTYTVLKRLCERGFFACADGVVTALVTRDAFYAMQSEKFVDETFQGSLPAFLAAFTRRKDLSEQEINEIQAMIDAARGRAPQG